MKDVIEVRRLPLCPAFATFRLKEKSITLSFAVKYRFTSVVTPHNGAILVIRSYPRPLQNCGQVPGTVGIPASRRLGGACIESGRPRSNGGYAYGNI